VGQAQWELSAFRSRRCTPWSDTNSHRRQGAHGSFTRTGSQGGSAHVGLVSMAAKYRVYFRIPRAVGGLANAVQWQLAVSLLRSAQPLGVSQVCQVLLDVSCCLVGFLFPHDLNQEVFHVFSRTQRLDSANVVHCNTVLSACQKALWPVGHQLLHTATEKTLARILVCEFPLRECAVL